MTNREADVCILVEGSYPYVAGGVTTWVQQLIEAQKDKSFHIISIVSPTQELIPCCQLLKNVVSLQTLVIQNFPVSAGSLSKSNRRQFYVDFEKILHRFVIKGRLEVLKELLDLFDKYPTALSEDILLNSPEAWQILLTIYTNFMSAASFIDFFWAWRNLFAGLYSVLAVTLPKARLYHAVCTGYAGVLMARAHLKYQAPCILTEHGIYTNERQIEITLADWIEYQKNFSLQMEKTVIDYDLKDFWMHTFINYAHICYEACSEIITLFEGNKEMQLASGASGAKLRVIPNGVDYDSFSQLTLDQHHPPTIALIGRVVPIKDVHTFIQACIRVKEKIPTLKAYVIGPIDEDREYYAECLETVKYAGLETTLTFTGKVSIKDYLPIIDVNVLTSLSESQPLVILESGAAGIPSVTTDVGSCRELLYGKEEEVGKEAIVKGGEIVEVGSPHAVAEAILKLLTDKSHLLNCREVIQRRVCHYYNKSKIDSVYRELYEKYLKNLEVNVA